MLLFYTSGCADAPASDAEYLAQLSDGGFYFLIVVEKAHIERVHGLGIEGFAQFKLLFYKRLNLVGSLTQKQRTDTAAHLQMFEKDLRRRLKIHGLGTTVHVIYVVKEAGRAASTAYHHVLELGNLVQHVAFYATETVFARLVEYLFDGTVHAALNVPVKVVEPPSGVLCERLAYGGLAGAHVSEEYYRSVHFLRCDAGFFFSGVAFTISMHFSYVSSAALECRSFGMR